MYVFAAGLDKDNFDVTVQNNLLTLSGECPHTAPEGANAYLQERFSGKFRRVLSLPEDIDPTSAMATYRNGVLHISFKRRGGGTAPADYCQRLGGE